MQAILMICQTNLRAPMKSLDGKLPPIAVNCAHSQSLSLHCVCLLSYLSKQG